MRYYGLAAGAVLTIWKLQFGESATLVGLYVSVPQVVLIIAPGIAKKFA